MARDYKLQRVNTMAEVDCWENCCARELLEQTRCVTTSLVLVVKLCGSPTLHDLPLTYLLD